MIQSDEEMRAAQERILLFERMLAEARHTYSASNYQAMAQGYLLEIDRMQGEIRAYLSQAPQPIKAA